MSLLNKEDLTMTHSRQSVLQQEPAKKMQDGLTKSMVPW